MRQQPQRSDTLFCAWSICIHSVGSFSDRIEANRRSQERRSGAIPAGSCLRVAAIGISVSINPVVHKHDRSQERVTLEEEKQQDNHEDRCGKPDSQKCVILRSWLFCGHVLVIVEIPSPFFSPHSLRCFNCETQLQREVLNKHGSSQPSRATRSRWGLDRAELHSNPRSRWYSGCWCIRLR